MAMATPTAPRRRRTATDNGAVEASKDPDNTETVILSRWPTEEEKTDDLKAKMADTRNQ
jgi:hypothetical protein